MTQARPGDSPLSGDAFGSHDRHASHDGLFTPVPQAGSGSSIDAVIVPTARPAEWMTDALRLSVALGCPVLALCSGDAKPAEVLGLASSLGAHHTVVVDAGAVTLPVTLTAGEIPGGFAPGGKYVDLSVKRNLGLALARMLDGWHRVLFLDDDITEISVPGLRLAAARLPDYTAIGLTVVGKPDNSVVCHAYREVGGRQSTFVGGGALLVPTDGDVSHFPDVYNEDWFFFMKGDRLGSVGRMGQARQRDYDPFDDPARAEAQEFGDCLAEGVYALLDDGRRLGEADLDYWTGYLRRRRRLIQGIVAKVPKVAGIDKRARMLASLDAAGKILAAIEARHCVDFLHAWDRDRVSWREFLQGLPPVRDVDEALDYFGLAKARVQ